MIEQCAVQNRCLAPAELNQVSNTRDVLEIGAPVVWGEDECTLGHLLAFLSDNPEIVAIGVERSDEKTSTKKDAAQKLRSESCAVLHEIVAVCPVLFPKDNVMGEDGASWAQVNLGALAVGDGATCLPKVGDDDEADARRLKHAVEIPNRKRGIVDVQVFERVRAVEALEGVALDAFKERHGVDNVGLATLIGVETHFLPFAEGRRDKILFCGMTAPNMQEFHG
jgi:hypothetical protein